MTFALRHRLLAQGLLALTVLGVGATPLSAAAATDPNGSELFNCVQQTFQQLARQQRLYRTVLLGRGTAAAAPQGAVWYDDETGDAWIKNDENSWTTVPADNPRSDSEMEDKVEKDSSWNSPFRRGLVSTRTTLTSSIIPPMVQAYRALSCRLETVCALTTGQVLGDNSQDAVDGCETLEELGLTAVEACTFTTESAPLDSIEASTTCSKAADGILAHEAEVLRLLVAYDAAVRTALQYAGVFDRLVRDLRYPLLWPLTELSGLVREISRIPCFLGICAP